MTQGLQNACAKIQPFIWSSRSKASSPWAKQHRVKPVPSWRNHTQGWMNVWESYSRAEEEQGTLVGGGGGGGKNFWKGARPLPTANFNKFGRSGRRADKLT